MYTKTRKLAPGLTHDHVLENIEDHAELITKLIEINEDDLEMEHEVDENLPEYDFAFNEQDMPIVKATDPEFNYNTNDEHYVSQGVVPLELKDIVSDSNELIELDSIDPTYKEVNDIPLHPSGRPVRKVTGKVRPMDEQFIYEM